MYRKLLIANRGEIALRIIRACRELDIKTVAIYSQADELSLHVRFADEAICIGPPESLKSYLNIPSIIAAAELTNADAVHPGYGFHSENAEFSAICQEHGLSFIGPTADTIRFLGDKANAKKAMRSVGVPVIPGSEGILKTPAEAKKLAQKIGYPVILKATAGGGGRGMRLVENPDQLENCYQLAQNEAQTAFDNGDLYLEKYFVNTRHIEVQVLADQFGNCATLGERECSIQRRHQKLVEESPSPVVTPEVRHKLYEAADKGIKAANYYGAGTMEFLVDNNLDFFFMEVNARIQVEHPVTEMVIGGDLIKNQIRCHAGELLPEWMLNAEMRGHSIECRINAEDPDHKFRPCPGVITSFHMPGGNGVRIDTHAYAGYKIPSYYDSMITKLIVHASTRKEAILRMQGALDECTIEGIKTNIPFHQALMKNEKFIAGDFNTGFLETFNHKSIKE